MVEAGWTNAKELLHLQADFKDIKPTFAMEALRKRVDAFTFMVNQREQEALNMTLDTALDQGWTPKQLAGEIGKTFADGYHITNNKGDLIRTVPTDYWSQTVARTELNRAQTMGALALYDAAGIKRVQWQTNHGSTVCDECQGYDGETYAMADAPECPAHPRCCCALIAADDDVKFSDADSAASAEYVDRVNQENDAALAQYNSQENP